MARSTAAFGGWSREELISRIVQLEKTSTTKRVEASDDARSTNAFDASAYPRRKIALKFTYHGAHYSGLEYQVLPSSLPTVEGVLFDALVRHRLIDPLGGLQGCGWEKCGRTDKGVSAAAQVVSLWVRSALGERKQQREVTEENVTEENLSPEAESSQQSPADDQLEGDLAMMGDWDEPPTNAALEKPAETTSEIPYVSKINRALPPTIRILAWSPVSDDFSARFSCRWRHYKYFFHPRGLDISAMQDAALRLIGEHDFRNLCRVDASKQLTSFNRRILSASIDPVEEDPNLYVLNLRGTAFLYNQVRHIMAVLFLVGTRLEQPSVIAALLNPDADNPRAPSREGEPQPPVVSCKPFYEMADPFPLVLWDTGYDEDAVSWQVDHKADAEVTPSTHPNSSDNVHDTMQAFLERSEIHTALDAHFLRAAAKYHRPSPQYFPIRGEGVAPVQKNSVLAVPLGGGRTYRRGGEYTPLLLRERNLPVEEINSRWRLGKGAKRLERKAASVTEAE
ncbi:pseudouridine synthase [Daedalea quercina L-15889]|uniref:Pseudouridine synthase n=1 Tax=Daedalea quercina L-15889 TaxID=1314783 RepID=A0A165QHC2_9APHY|nr:pseudouridine synthase [Daedalea quercina L-15889]